MGRLCTCLGSEVPLASNPRFARGYIAVQFVFRNTDRHECTRRSEPENTVTRPIDIECADAGGLRNDDELTTGGAGVNTSRQRGG